MTQEKSRTRFFKNPPLQLCGVLILLCLAALLLWFNMIHNTQSVSPIFAQVRFYGEYRIGDDPWQEIVEGQHISASKGDVTLRGNFHLLAPDGEYVGIYSADAPIAFYMDHINVTVMEEGCDPYIFELEDPRFKSSACGVFWNAFVMSGGEAPMEIRIHNPHVYGNENAVDELLSNFAFWSGIEFERGILDRGQSQRNLALLLVVVAFAMLGSALFSALLHMPSNRLMWLLGATILAAAVYLAFSAPGVTFWSGSIAFNTSVLGFSMMFYMLFNAGIITGLLDGTKTIGYITTFVLGILDGIFLLLPVLTGCYFYDTWLPWVIAQSAANLVLFICLIKECVAGITKRWIRIGMALLLLGFEVDAIATAAGSWEGGFVSRYVFGALFITALFVVLRIIPENINATEKAKDLELQRSRLEAEKNIVEAQLKESRISILLSQIQPHFIYNTLGTIERMCLKDPEKAFELVRNFSLYLRGNFSEIDSVTPIRFAEELKHIQYYVNIEQVRFPDMTIEYQVETTDFLLPALSVQPLVENAIKHGLMRLESGGTVMIRTFETPTHFCVEVKDDGVGFDPAAPIDGKKHVGLRNIRGRLKAMVNGELTIESQPGAGTRAVILIPKE